MKFQLSSAGNVLLLLLGISVGDLSAQEQTGNTGFIPHVGQDGKDVIWVPTPKELVARMLEIAGVCDTDYVVDLGSGDGRTVIAAAKLGAHSVGVEYNHDMVELSEKKALEEGVSDKAKFIKADLFDYDLSHATVITMFLLPEINLKLRPRLLNLRPGTRIVSNTFTMGEWEPDNEVLTDGNWISWNTALLWIVPAKIEGSWEIGKETLIIHQEFQKIYGSLGDDITPSIIIEGRVNGESVSFNANGIIYSGKIYGETIKGTFTSGAGSHEWTAHRIANH